MAEQRLIDANALKKLYADRLTVVAERYSPDSSECGILSGAMKLLEIQPTIEERKTGKWIRITQGAMPEKYMCLFCHRTVEHEGTEYFVSMMYPFCHCGADMRGKTK